MLLPDDDAVYAFLRRWEGTELLVLGNFTAQVRRVDVPDAHRWAGAELLLGNVGDPVPVPGDPIPDLRPWEARVYRRSVPGRGTA
jgi:oligo-1,6-glucosidase